MLQEMGIGRYREWGWRVVGNGIVRCKQWDDVLQGTVQCVAGNAEVCRRECCNVLHGRLKCVARNSGVPCRTRGLCYKNSSTLQELGDVLHELRGIAAGQLPNGNCR